MNENIKNSHPTKAMKGAIIDADIALAKVFNFSAFLIVKIVVATEITEKTIPILVIKKCQC